MQQNYVEIVGDIVSRALTLEWAVVGLIVSFVISLIIGNASRAPFFALIAVALHQPVHVLINLLREGKNVVGGDLLTALQNRFTNPDIIVLLVEFIAYTFLIWVMFVSRIDMMRDVPPPTAEGGYSSHTGH
jgi:hypothetical protein